MYACVHECVCMCVYMNVYACMCICNCMCVSVYMYASPRHCILLSPIILIICVRVRWPPWQQWSRSSVVPTAGLAMFWNNLSRHTRHRWGSNPLPSHLPAFLALEWITRTHITFFIISIVILMTWQLNIPRMNCTYRVYSTYCIHCYPDDVVITHTNNELYIQVCILMSHNTKKYYWHDWKYRCLAFLWQREHGSLVL